MPSALQRSAGSGTCAARHGLPTLVESDQPIIVQHTRLDSRQPANSIMTTIAHPV
nr:sensory rhodopsin transducer [Stenotrophomonas maltophilia]